MEILGEATYNTTKFKLQRTGILFHQEEVSKDF